MLGSRGQNNTEQVDLRVLDTTGRKTWCILHNFNCSFAWLGFGLKLNIQKTTTEDYQLGLVIW